jgi:hypothetical protein
MTPWIWNVLIFLLINLFGCLIFLTGILRFWLLNFLHGGILRKFEVDEEVLTVKFLIIAFCGSLRLMSQLLQLWLGKLWL